ncbi:LamG domain-containing protein, partial [bacterium]|nr:LamG domain-containing protein [bacterium]
IPRKEAKYVLPTNSAGGVGFHLRFFLGMGGWQPPVISDTVVKYGEWHYLAGTYDGKELKVFIDGKVDKAQNQAGDIVATTDPLRWSNDCCGGRMLEGILDELAILNRALDESEMTQMMAGILTALAVKPTGKLAVSWGSIKNSR